MKDQLGAICSGLCIVHCLVTPIILALGVTGIVTTIFTTELFHLFLVIPVSLLLLLTFIQSYKEHGTSVHLLAGLLGIAFLISALVLNEQYEATLTIIGGTLLVTYHMLNLRQQHKNRENKLNVDSVTS